MRSTIVIRKAAAKAVREFFHLPDDENAPAIKKSHAASGGPDQQFELWRDNEKRLKPWLSLSAHQNKQARPKAIFSSQFFMARTREYLDEIIMTELLKVCDLYLWNSEEHITTQKPISSIKEFWSKLPDHVAVGQEKIKKELGEKQKVQVSDYSIVDRLAYTKIMQQVAMQVNDELDEAEKIALENVKTHIADVRNIPLTRYTKPSRGLVNATTLMKCHAPKKRELELLSEYPHITHMEIEGATQEWVNANLAQLNVSHITLTDYLSDSILLKKDFKLETIIITSASKSIWVRRAKGCQIKEVHFKTTTKPVIAEPVKNEKTASEIKVEVKKINNPYQVKTAEQSKPKDLLISQDPRLISLDFIQSLPDLEYIKLDKCNNLADEDKDQDSKDISPELFKFPHHPNITRLAVIDCKSRFKRLDLTALTNLQELKATKLTHLIVPASVNRLYLSDMEIHSLDLSHCKDLETLVIDGNNNQLTQINLKGLKKLKKIIINGIPADCNIDSQNCDNLFTLQVHVLASKSEDKVLQVYTEGCEYLRKLDIQSPHNEVKVSIEKLPALAVLKIEAAKFTMCGNCFLPGEFQYRLLENGKQEIMHAVNSLNQTEEKESVSFQPIDDELNELNDASVVSIFQPETSDRADGQTGKPTAALEAEGNFKISFYGHPETHIQKNQYRTDILDSMVLTIDEKTKKTYIDFISTCDESRLEKVNIPIARLNKDIALNLRDKIKLDRHATLACYEGALEKGEIYRLPSLHPISQKNQILEIYSGCPDAITLFWHPDYQQYVITLNEDQPSEKVVNLFYKIAQPKNVRHATDKTLTVARTKSDPAVLNLLIKRLKDHKPLVFLFDEKLDVKTKIGKLIEYTTPPQFLDENLDLSKYINDSNKHLSYEELLGTIDNVEIFIETILQQRGACRHRSRVFMALAHLINVPVHMITNEKHQLCEIPYATSNGIYWQLKDLGGTLTRDATKKREDYFDKIGASTPTATKTKGMPVVVPSASFVTASIPATPHEEKEYAPAPPAAMETKITPVDAPSASLVTASIPATPHEEKEYAPALPTAMETKITPVDAPSASLVTASIPATPAAPLVPTDAEDQLYYKLFKNIIEQSKLSSLLPILDTKSESKEKEESKKDKEKKENIFNPTIVLKADQNPLTVNQHILRHLGKETKIDPIKQHVYIHSAEDFNKFLKPYLLADNKRTEIDGPLHDLLKPDGPGGVIVINWTNFSDTEIASFHSMLSTPSNLFHIPIPANVKIIGLIDGRMKSSPSFSSRTKRWILDDTFLQQPQEEKIQSYKETLEIDLHNRSDWRDPLYGDINYQGDDVSFEKGALLQAITEQKNLIIYNPPKDDEDFDLLVHQIKHEEKFFFNGSWIKVPKEFSLKMEERKSTLKNDDLLIKIHTTESKRDNRERIYIGTHNLHQCFKELVIRDDKPYTISGMLDRYIPEKQIFNITGRISKSNWNRIQAHIAELQKKTNRKFEFCLTPGASIEDGESSTQEPTINTGDFKLALLNKQNVFTSNDPDLLASQIADEIASEEKLAPLIIDLSPQTSFKDLIAEIKKKSGAALQFSYKNKAMLEELIKGRTIILNGEMSLDLYYKLLPLLSGNSDSIRCNGAPVKTEGRLIAVMPISNMPLIHQVKQEYDFKHYQDILISEDKANAEKLERIKNFYDYAIKLPHAGQGRPSLPSMSYQHLKHMLAALKEKNPLHPHNPIKGLFLYDYLKNSEDYDYLNVIAKYFLLGDDDKTPPRRDKLNDKNKNIWSFLNCFNGQQLRDIFENNIEDAIDFSSGNPTLKPRARNMLQAMVHNINLTPEEKESKLKPTTAEKQTAQLQRLLDSDKPVIFLKGPPGVGKTHTIRQLKSDQQCEYFEGNEAGILRWLTDKTLGKKKILLLDEVNKSAPGTWNFLKGLFRKDKTIYYNGEIFPELTDGHKVIATGNPENLPDRYYHDFLQNYAETLYLKKPDDDFLTKTILKSNLESRLFKDEYTELLLFSYHLIEKYEPFFPTSIRDVENVAARFNLLAKNINHPDSLRLALFNACVSEFSGAISDVSNRQTFINDLKHEFAITNDEQKVTNDLIPISKNHSVTQAKKYLIDAIDQDLRMRDESIKNGSVHHKQGVLIEGDSGLGKTTLFEQMLLSRGFTLNNPDPRKKYYIISAGTNNAHEILKKAFEEESVVILDELNLDKDLENLLNQLLSGADADGNLKCKPGFTVLASQNPSHFEGREALSPALLNRMHYLCMDNFSIQELTDIAANANIKSPEKFVNAFMKIRDEFPDYINMRTFYNVLKSIARPLEKVEEQYRALGALIENIGFWKTKSNDVLGRAPATVRDLNAVHTRLKDLAKTKPLSVADYDAAFAEMRVKTTKLKEKSKRSLETTRLYSMFQKAPSIADYVNSDAFKDLQRQSQTRH